MSVIEITITNPKKQLEFYKQLCEQLQQENQQLKEKIQLRNKEKTDICNKLENYRQKIKRYKNEITNLISSNKKTKEQLKSKEQELKGFTNAIAEYLGFDEPEHTIYDEIFDKINQLKIKLQQSEEVIEEAMNKIETLRMEKWSITGTDIMALLDILNKYKGSE